MNNKQAVDKVIATLSPAMVDALRMSCRLVSDVLVPVLEYGVNTMVRKALERRGLVEWGVIYVYSNGGPMFRWWVPTALGYAVLDALGLLDVWVENCFGSLPSVEWLSPVRAEYEHEYRLARCGDDGGDNEIAYWAYLSFADRAVKFEGFRFPHGYCCGSFNRLLNERYPALALKRDALRALSDLPAVLYTNAGARALWAAVRG